MAHDGEAQAQAAVATGDRGIALTEVLEDEGQEVGGDALAGVGDRDPGPLAGPGQPHVDLAAGLRELDGVGQHVRHRLLQAPRVAGDVTGARVEHHGEGDALAPGAGAHRVGGRVDHRAQIHRVVADAEGAGEGARGVEDVLDQLGLGLRVARDHLDPAGQRGLVGPAGPQDVGPAEHRVERGAQLVRHVGQELVLHPVGDLGLRPGRVLPRERCPAIVQLALQALVELGVLDRVGGQPHVQVDETALGLGRPPGLRKVHREHADDVTAPGEQRRALTGAEASAPGGVAIGREHRVGLGVLDHHRPALGIGDGPGPAPERHPLDLLHECGVEPAMHAQSEARLQVAQGEQAHVAALQREDRVQHLAQQRLEVDRAGETRAHLVQPAQVRDLVFQLGLHRAQRHLDAAALGHLGLQRRGLLLKGHDRAQPLVRAVGLRVALGRDHAVVLAADRPHRLEEALAAEPAHGIGAQEAERTLGEHLVPEILQPDGGGGVAGRQQQADHLADHAGRSVAADPVQQLADHLAKAAVVGRAPHHDPREGVGRVHRDEASRRDRAVDVEAAGAQPTVQAGAVLAGGDDERAVAGGEPISHELAQRGEQRTVILVELDEVLVTLGRLLHRATRLRLVSKRYARRGRAGRAGICSWLRPARLPRRDALEVFSR